MFLTILFIEYLFSFSLFLDLFVKIIFGAIIYLISLNLLRLEEFKLVYKSKKFN